MVAPDMHNPAEGYIRTAHSVQGLPRVVRHITGHNTEGKSVFLSTDGDDHHREPVNNSAIANIIYPTNQHDEGDIKYAHENEPSTTIQNGSVCRMVDFAPGGVTPMHRIDSLDYAIVIEGVFRLVLDSGEERIMQRGEIAILRSTAHEWVNETGNGLLPARILFVLLDINETRKARIGGEKAQRELAVQSHEVSWKKPARVRVAYVYDNDFFDSEF